MLAGLSKMPRILYVSDCIFFPSRLTGQINLALSPLKSASKTIDQGSSTAPLVACTTSHVLRKFRFAVDYRQTTIRKLQREGGSVNFEGLSNRDIVEDSGVLISVVTVTSVDYLDLQILCGGCRNANQKQTSKTYDPFHIVHLSAEGDESVDIVDQPCSVWMNDNAAWTSGMHDSSAR